MNPGEFTEDEIAAIEAAGQAFNALTRVAKTNQANAKPVEGDLTEAAAAVHVLQCMAMSSAAARANPDTVRPFGAGHPS
jgi:predicted DNA-binding transcriptional regulator YafY